MLKNLLGAFIGSKIEQRTGHPVAGAVIGATAVAIARRSLPLAIGLAAGVAAMELFSRYKARQVSVPAFER